MRLAAIDKKRGWFRLVFQKAPITVLPFLIAVYLGTSVCAAEPAALYGMLESTLDHAAEGRSIGLRVAIISVIWERSEPEKGVFNGSILRKLPGRKRSSKNWVTNCNSTRAFNTRPAGFLPCPMHDTGTSSETCSRAASPGQPCRTWCLTERCAGRSEFISTGFLKAWGLIGIMSGLEAESSGS